MNKNIIYVLIIIVIIIIAGIAYLVITGGMMTPSPSQSSSFSSSKSSLQSSSLTQSIPQTSSQTSQTTSTGQTTTQVSQKNYTFIIIASGLSFNGTTPGPKIQVPNGSNVTIIFIVSGSLPHSFVIVPIANPNLGPGNQTYPPFPNPAFPGASTPNPTLGLNPGSRVVINFIANKPGTYIYLCEVDSHYNAGMWGLFVVTS